MVVTHEFVKGAVELIRAGLGDGVDDRARAMAVLGAVVVGEDAELLERIGIRREGGGVELRVVVVAAVEEVVVRDAAGAVDGVGGGLAEVGGGGVAGDGAGDEQLELQCVAAVERQFGDAFFVDGFADGSPGGFDERNGAADLTESEVSPTCRTMAAWRV